MSDVSGPWNAAGAHRIAERLIAARRAKGWWQHDLAYRVGLSPRQLDTIERGTRAASPILLQRLARALSLDPDALLQPVGYRREKANG